MFKTILVPTDGSAPSRRAEDAALMLARAGGATLVMVAVAESANAGPQRSVSPPGDDALLAAQERVQATAARALAAGIPCQCSVAVSSAPWEEILKSAADLCCDAIVMAAYGVRGPQALALGSQAQHVLANARLPVMIFR